MTSQEVTFGEWLRQRRRALDWTQAELADRAGCARITLRRIEADELKPSKELAAILLEKVGIPEPGREAWIHFARGLSPLPAKAATVTFLFTDVEGSTRLASESAARWESLRQRQDAILQSAAARQNGRVFQTVGDANCLAFSSARDGLDAALDAQRRLQTEDWGARPIKVRMGLHTGEAELLADGNYQGYLTLSRVQRVMAAAHGGQVLLSQPTHDLLQHELPEGVALRDMGEHRLKDLRTPIRLYQLVAPGLPQDFLTLKSLDAFPNNLPAQLTSFIGREKEIADVKGLIDSARLITLTGSGGTGKTRLSQEVAGELLQTFPDGMWLIELAPLAEPSQIIPAIAQVLGLQELPFRPLASQVMDYLREKRALLILDNCEHLIGGCARLAEELLHRCAGLKILASSREALGIVGEMAYSTPSLGEAESLRLFADRARAANSNFSLTESNSPTVARICARLDGIPLAIELAAARVKLLSPEQIAVRLDDRFRLLIGGSRTATPRQQTLRALIDWSYDLLSDEEQRLLQNSSVFVGGWTLDALEAVADDPNILEPLEQLVNKSLVVTEERGNEMRYSLLETIRQYAREKLFDAGQAPAARDRHFVFFLELSEWMWHTLRSGNAVGPVVKRAEDEVENFRAALEWGREHQVEKNLRLAASFCFMSSLLTTLAEGVTTAGAAIARARALPPAEGEAALRRQTLMARALYAQGTVGLWVGPLPAVLQTLRDAIAVSRAAGDKRTLGYSLEMYYIASILGNAADGVEAAQEGLRIFSQEVDDRFGLTMAYVNMVSIASRQGDESERQRYLVLLRETMREMTGPVAAGLFLLGLGMSERLRGDYGAARRIFEEGISRLEGIGTSHYRLSMRSELGHVERQSGNFAKAESIYRETIKGYQDLGNREAIAHQLECFGFLAIAGEEPRRAARLFGAAQALRERAESPRTDPEPVEFDQVVVHLRGKLAETEFDALWAEGRALTMQQAVQLALQQEPTG